MLPADAPPPPEPTLARMRRSPATSGLAAALVAIFVLQLLDPQGRLERAFAKVNGRVLDGEVWRLFTASFLHAGLAHLAFNTLALLSIGPAIERLYGRLRFVVIFLLGGAVGYVASVALVPAPSLGASAGVFALLGALLAYALRARHVLTARSRQLVIREVLFIVALNLGLGLLAGFVDNAAHVGGLAGGFALGLGLRPSDARQPARAGPPV